MGDTKSKTAKAAKDSIPWAAVVVAVLGWYDARDTGKDAAADAARAGQKAQVAQVESAQTGEARLRNAYDEIVDALDEHEDRMVDMEHWIVDLEDWVEDHIEEDSPRTSREREARAERLALIRKKKSARAREKAKRDRTEPAAAKLRDYDAVQMAAPPAKLDIEDP